MKLAAVAVLALTQLVQPSAINQVVERLDAYLLAYEPQLSELIADESMVQETKDWQNAGPYRGRKKIVSEVAFIALPQEGGWLGFRHVKTVNNVRVTSSDESLSLALKIQGLDAAQQLLRASAAYNLGAQRTTNLPNLPLEFLHRRNRPRLAVQDDGSESVRGVKAARLMFVEQMTPTRITQPDTGADMPSVIRAWVDPRSGRLLRAEVRTFQFAKAKRHQASVRVEFVQNNTVGLMVPSEMREEYPVLPYGSGTSVARYTNFRRFTTGGRIVTPKS